MLPASKGADPGAPLRHAADGETGSGCVAGGDKQECRLSAALACWNQAVTRWKPADLGLKVTTCRADTSSRSVLVKTL